MLRCPQCDKDALVDASTSKTQFAVGPVMFEVDIPAKKCSSCGQDVLHGGYLESARLTAILKVIDLGLARGGVLKQARKAVGLGIERFAKLTAISRADIESCEAGLTAPSAAHLALLAALIEDYRHGRQTTIEHLQAMQQPALAPPGRIELPSTGAGPWSVRDLRESSPS